MKVSLNHLKKYVDINVTAEELAEKMPLAGFEIESMEKQGEGIKRVVAAKILKITPHEDSDHLQICQTDIGESEPVQIVTGAQNIKEGDYVPAALNDSFLPDGTHIVSGKLRGVESHGMLCSGEELGLTEGDYEGAGVYGILILKGEPVPGTDIKEVLGLNDTIIDFSITSNRPDAGCFLGIAKEISVVLGTEFKSPETSYKTVGGNIDAYINVSVANSDLCPRYMGRMVKNLRIAPSPLWMQRAIIASGMRPINNIVDITNFVMLETGQPMHAFNYNELKDKKIIVRNAQEGEKIVTLDGNEFALTPDMLVIADGKNPSCLAGIMGGKESEIEDDTTDLFLECAKFRRDNIRHTAHALGIHTESCARFQKGVDINNVEYAMNRALSLIYELDAGDIIDGTADVRGELPKNRIIKTTTDKVLELIGVDVPKDIMISILNKLGLETTLDGNEMTVSVPSIRDDVEGRADLAEEIMRIYGYSHIKGRPMRGEVTRGRKLPERVKADKIKSLLCAAGAREIATYSFINPAAADTLGLKEDDERRKMIKILNPLGDEYSAMRTQLVWSMLSVISTNLSRKIESARFFEISKRFKGELPLKAQPHEIPVLAIGIYGEDEDFFSLKGIIEAVMKLCGAHTEYRRSDEQYLHPGRQAAVYANNTLAGTFGEVHPAVAEKLGIETRVYVAEIKLEVLYGIKRRKPTYKPLPKFPAVERDFALIVDVDTPIGDIQKAICSGAGRLLEKIKLFDVYTGSQIPQGKKSVAFSVWLRSNEGTLSEEQTESVCTKIIDKLTKIGGELRK
ncbi:MAG: phenylalanine--tRNA ligase subunit beta [Clostridia bacterium]|nr:phenylalanine--tRNA ligase subunit beta [Clostridia bacterium]